MNQTDRQVLEFINMKKIVSTAELCETFGHSESTARRVLQRLSDRGLIQRYHGGGVSNQYKEGKIDIYKRFDQAVKEKERIAKCAAQQIKPGNTVILLGGTTVYKMCKYLKDMKITVITNSVLVFDELKDNPRINMILLGGSYNLEEKEIRGVLTNFSLKLLRADSLFMGTVTFHPDVGFLTVDMEAVELYRLCIETVKHTYVLADSSKIGKEGSAVMATCQMVDCLITDEGIPYDIEEAFKEKGVRVLKI